MKWNTNKIIRNLEKELSLKAIVTANQNPECGNYCRDIYVDLKNTTISNSITIAGFNLSDISSCDTPIENIEYVEIRTQDSDSDGGLPKNSTKEIRELYFIVVDYFNKHKIQIVDNLRDYF